MFHDMSAVATALPGESIWKGINRAAFERTAFALKEHAPEPRDYTKLERSATCCGATLPLEVEQRLASDFAFLAATSSRPSAVAAATIECSSSGLMTVRLAANEGIEDGDFRAMEEVANILRFYAVRDLKHGECRQKLFDTVAAEHFNYHRICERLGARGRTILEEQRGPLPQRFETLLEKNASRYSDPTDVAVVAMRRDVFSFNRRYNRIHHIQHPNTRWLQKVVKSAYKLTRNGYELDTRLKEIEYPYDPSENWDMRQVLKVANYWRICKTLAECCRSYRHLFKQISCVRNAPYRPSKAITCAKRLFVHAEIQLLVFYELNPNAARPRAIGTSKKACFLCDTFIRAHNVFCITKAHRRIYPQWVVPDLRGYSPRTVRRFRHGLQQAYNDLMQENGTSVIKRPYPAESSTHSLPLVLSPPSESTVVPESASTMTVTSMISVAHVYSEVSHQDLTNASIGTPPIPVDLATEQVANALERTLKSEDNSNNPRVGEKPSTENFSSSDGEASMSLPRVVALDQEEIPSQATVSPLSVPVSALSNLSLDHDPIAETPSRDCESKWSRRASPSPEPVPEVLNHPVCPEEPVPRRVDSMFDGPQKMAQHSNDLWTVSEDTCVIAHSDWVNLHVNMQRPEHEDSDRQSGYRIGRLQIEKVGNIFDDVGVFELQDIPYDRDLVVAKSDSDSEADFCFVLRQDLERAALLRFKWIS